MDASRRRVCHLDHAAHQRATPKRRASAPAQLAAKFYVGTNFFLEGRSCCDSSFTENVGLCIGCEELEIPSSTMSS